MRPAEGMLSWVEYAAMGVELLAVALIVGVILTATVSYVRKIFARQADLSTYDAYRHQLGARFFWDWKSWMAADIIRTVVLEPTLRNVLVLGLLVFIRTFLSWSLVLEIEGRWPWQALRSRIKD